MPQSSKIEVKFDRNLNVHDGDHTKPTTELINVNDFYPICYEENDPCSRDLFLENNNHAGYKRESDHR